MAILIAYKSFIVIIRIIVLIYPENIVFNLGNQGYPNFINKVRFLSYHNGMAVELVKRAAINVLFCNGLEFDLEINLSVQFS